MIKGPRYHEVENCGHNTELPQALRHVNIYFLSPPTDSYGVRPQIKIDFLTCQLAVDAFPIGVAQILKILLGRVHLKLREKGAVYFARG
jgi:hypothetical protein